jgi:hypothetical protein
VLGCDFSRGERRRTARERFRWDCGLSSKLSRRTLLTGVGPLLAAAAASGKPQHETVERWGVYELYFKGPGAGNPFLDVQFSAEFRLGNRSVPVSGFYDGNGTYRLRFMPDDLGNWIFVTQSNSPDLNGHEGGFLCGAPAEGNRGPVMVRDPHHLCYADGSAHLSFGTTCYAWAHQAESLERQTLQTLREAPFNKVRMCVLPTEKNPQRFPFERSAAGENDLLRFDVSFFRHFDRRIQDLRDMGIQADLILFHPYDKLGYGNMPAEVNRRYLRYVVARFAAFRNVWWSIANEYDLVKTKSMPEWDEFFRIVQESDPYGHLRSVHHSRVFYDYSKPWVTHLSLQSDNFAKTQEWLAEYKKPIIFDECKYEGNINRRWGNLSGHEMMRRFWIGMVSGAYVGHGETYHTAENTAWTSQGGTLLGKSPQRIAFLKKIFEEAPALELNAPADPYYPLISNASEYYLYFFDLHQPIDYEVTLPGDASFTAEIIDPWEMTITRAPESYQGKCLLKLPGKPYLAVRLRAV